MSAAIDRLRDVLALCPTGGVFLGEDYARTAASALDALDAQRARAEAAEAEVARLRRAVDAAHEHYGKHWTRAQHTAVAAVAWEMRPKAAAADALAPAVSP